MKHFDSIEEYLRDQSDLAKKAGVDMGYLSLIKGEPGKDAEMIGPKGDKGDPGKDGKSITGPQGPEGKVSEVPGPIGDKGEQGFPGKDGINGKDGSADSPVDIRKKLESLKKDDRLPITAIKGVSKLRDEIVTHSVTQARGLLYAGLLENAGTTGGGGAWGSITGTLSNQTDLQTALNAKQATLVSGTNIKTINGSSLLGSGDVATPQGTIIGSTGSTDNALLRADGTGGVTLQSSLATVSDAGSVLIPESTAFIVGGTAYLTYASGTNTAYLGSAGQIQIVTGDAVYFNINSSLTTLTYSSGFLVKNGLVLGFADVGSTGTDAAFARSGVAEIVVIDGIGGEGNLKVLDEAYGSGWNGSHQVPTKNAIYDKLETISSDVLFDHFTDAGNTGTGEDDLYSDTLIAGQLSTNGQKIEAQYGGIFVSSATATRQLRIYFGGTLIFDTGALTLSTSEAWTAYVTVIRVSASVVRCMTSLTTEGAALAAYTSYTEVTGLTLANTQVLKITGEAAGVGAATGDIIAKLGYIEFKPAS